MIMPMDYSLAWNPYESQRDQTERARQRWLRREAIRARKPARQSPFQPGRLSR